MARRKIRELIIALSKTPPCSAVAETFLSQLNAALDEGRKHQMSLTDAGAWHKAYDFYMSYVQMRRQLTSAYAAFI